MKKIDHGIIYTTDGRYVKILEVEPINFLLRSAREQMGIIYSFISYLKISPVKLQIKMISKRADINQHLEKSRKELKMKRSPVPGAAGRLPEVRPEFKLQGSRFPAVLPCYGI